ncbi:hypothetical protein C2E23DRAFT_240840 [Lenzites betulinus]|nr:hypothetical protein C2E23DRAFT_240840 [Lenzites betulinus]
MTQSLRSRRLLRHIIAALCRLSFEASCSILEFNPHTPCRSPTTLGTPPIDNSKSFLEEGLAVFAVQQLFLTAYSEGSRHYLIIDQESYDHVPGTAWPSKRGGVR